MDSSIVINKYSNILASGEIPRTSDEYKTRGVTLSEVEHLVNSMRSYIATCSDESTLSTEISRLAELIVGLGIIHKFNGEDRDFSEEDFPDTSENAVKCFKCLEKLLMYYKDLEKEDKRNFLINVVFLIASYKERYLWSNEESVAYCEKFLEKLLDCTGHQSITNLLLDETFNFTIFYGILKKLRPSLEKNTWMLNPSSCHVFFWFLQHVKHPYLLDYIPYIFPPPFMFVCYHAVPQKVIGIKCFDHLLGNIPPTVIKLDGKEDAIIDAIRYLTYDKNMEIIEVLYPCMLKLPIMKQQNKSLTIEVDKLSFWDEYEKLLHHLLISLDMECNLAAKQIYLSHALLFIDMKPPFNHLKLIKSILKSSLVTPLVADKTCQVTSLKILKKVVKSCLPRMKFHCYDFLIFIIELLSEATFDDCDERYLLSEECLRLLKVSCKEEFQNLVESFIKNPDMPDVPLLKTIMEES